MRYGQEWKRPLQKKVTNIANSVLTILWGRLGAGFGGVAGDEASGAFRLTLGGDLGLVSRPTIGLKKWLDSSSPTALFQRPPLEKLENYDV